MLSVLLFGRGLILRVCCITWASASEIKRENPIKSENLPGCAVQMGSVAGIIVHNVSNRGFDVKLYFTRFHVFHKTNAFKAPTLFRNHILKNQLHRIPYGQKNSSLKSAISTPKLCRNQNRMERLAGAVERFVCGSGGRVVVSKCRAVSGTAFACARSELGGQAVRGGIGWAWTSGGLRKRSEAERSALMGEV